ncbi:MAG: hypothetical protein M3O62_06625 [Pseudomonadota bacterium]|nr:hypothetical protein [Pseudomonadota bacterium]
MSVLTVAEVINLYLCGTWTPSEDFRAGSVMRSAGAAPATYQQDVNDFMAGPGRFASPAMFEVVQLFFSSAGTNLAPGTYTEQQIRPLLGTNQGSIPLAQWEFEDSTDNSVSGLALERHGTDYLDGVASNDRLQGGGLSDVLRGGTGNARLDGDISTTPAQYQGGDRLGGREGNDELLGWGGNDMLLDGAGDDILQSGEGDDRLVLNGLSNALLVGRCHSRLRWQWHHIQPPQRLILRQLRSRRRKHPQRVRALQ